MSEARTAMPLRSVAAAFAVCLALSVLATGCSMLNSAAGGNTEQDALAALRWDFEKDGLRVLVDADAALNRYDDQAHTLVIAVMQSSDPVPYYQLLGNEPLLRKLLLSGGTPSGALQFSRFAIQPGRQQSIVLDRFASTQHVAIIAAYYGAPPTKTTVLLKLPVTLHRSGWVAKTYTARAPAAEVRLKLGADMITAATVAAYMPPASSSSSSAKPAASGAGKTSVPLPTPAVPAPAVRLDDLPAS